MPAFCLVDPPLLRDFDDPFWQGSCFTGSFVWQSSERGRSGSSRGDDTLRCLLAKVRWMGSLRQRC